MQIIDTSLLDEKAETLSNSEVYWVYNGLDCCVTMEVFEQIEPQLDDVSRATYENAMELLGPVMEMMLVGLPVNLTRRQEVLGHYRARFEKLEKMWVRLCHEGLDIPKDRSKRKGRSSVPVNIASYRDIQFLFHEMLGIPEKKKRRKGSAVASASTDRDTLEGFRNYFYAEPFVNFILAQRDELKSMGFLRTPLDDDGRMRCSFNVAGTDTGRLSSSFSDEGTGTNLQNVTGKLKDIFWAPPGQMVIDVDLEQGDSRGVAAIAWNMFVESHGEAFAGKYLDACESGDLHTTVCQMAWKGLAWTDTQSMNKKVAEQIAYRDLSFRDLSKKLGHGSNYMGQPPTMAMHTKLPVGLIQDFQREYFGAFPCITAWQQETIRLLQTTRQLTTLWGRRRYFWNDPNATSTKNAAIAYAPQNTTGEFMNRGLIQLFRYRNAMNFPIQFMLQVHDSGVFLADERRINEIIPVLLRQLRIVLPLAKGREFTIPHGVKVGWNYGRYDEKENPYGLKAFKGEETRTPPKRQRSLLDFMDTQVGNIR